jgi:bis(5'-nucleosidyl)-tetraphosphatase
MQPENPHKPERLSAGVIVVHEVGGELRYLLLRVYKNWDFPKGLVESNESPLDAARREVKEETGLSNLQFRWAEAYFETEPYARGKVARYYLAYSPSSDVTLGINPTLGRAEHHEYRWMNYRGAYDRLVPRIRAALDWAKGRIDG